MPTIAPPLRVTPAYHDRPGILDIVRRRSPYSLMAVGGGYDGASDEHGLLPWFRAYWALDGGMVDDEVAALLEHALFVTAARELFGVGTDGVVEPATLIVNLMGPMGVGQQHVDTPTYRGIKRSEVPPWLLMVMGQSALFERWVVKVASALTWFYDGTDGDYRQWPEGLDQPALVEPAPFGNVAVVSDSDVTYHQVGPVGDRPAFAAACSLEPESQLCSRGSRWEIVTGGKVAAMLDDNQLRISLLWRALVFADDEAAARYHAHDDDIDLATVHAMLGADLERRGIEVPGPADVLDPEWAGILTAVYFPALHRPQTEPDRLAQPGSHA